MTNYLFCFLGGATKASASVNQRREAGVCRKLGCGYLDETGPEIKCSHEPNSEYYNGLLIFSKPLKKKGE
jgi:hypothetical protein